MKKLLSRTLGVAVLAAALLAPAGAEAQNYQFKCEGCTTVGNGPTVYSNQLYFFTLNSPAAYDFAGVGTNAGDIVFKIYLDPGATQVHSTMTLFAGSNPETLIGDDIFFNPGTYYIGATGSCTGPGNGCNAVLKMSLGSGDVSTVPEPATIALVASGLVGVAILRRRRNSEG